MPLSLKSFRILLVVQLALFVAVVLLSGYLVILCEVFGPRPRGDAFPELKQGLAQLPSGDITLPTSKASTATAPQPCTTRTLEVTPLEGMCAPFAAQR